MKRMLPLEVIGFAVLFAASASPGSAQTATTAVVLGTVTDPRGGVIPDANVDLINPATNETKTVKTNQSGLYVFPSTAPGTYTLKFTKQGFATTNIGNVVVSVAKSYTYDVQLEIKSGTEVVEVTAEARAELQTTDSVVGNVVGGTALLHLPTLQRDSRELLTLQPGSTPYETSNGGGFGDSGGTVAGARSDQNAFNLDGIDVTDNVIAGGGNQVPIIPIGVESLDEFRVGITNNNATFGRASGGQINLVSKSGTNSFHGSAYWFHQNSVLNANSWDNNHTPDGTGNPFTARKPQHDNRAGFTFGGPLRRNNTFFFGNYEVRRFPQSVQISRIVPTDSLKAGNLIFNGTSYNLATSTACGSSGDQPCDPRGIGISPTIAQLWNMMPEGNDPSLGDGVNTIGLRANVAEPLKDDNVNFRLDHNFTQKVHFFGRYLYHRNLSLNASGSAAGQIDLRSGTPINTSGSFLRGDGFITGLEWQHSNTLSSSFRVGWIRSRQDFAVVKPSASAAELNLPGTQVSIDGTDYSVALAPGLGQTGLIDTVIDVDTQRARHQSIYDSNKQYGYTLNWIKGKHAVVAGLDFRWLPTIHDRDDKVIGSLNSLVATLDADVSGILTIPDANRPPLASAADAQRWDRLYAASLGLVDSVGVLAVRDGGLQPKPLGTTLVARATLRAQSFFAQDTWRMKPSFTVTYGVSYGWQTTPHEANRQQTLIANHDQNDQIINAFDYLNEKAVAAANGDIFNPTLSYVPINSSGRRDVFNVDFGNVAPRVSAAWNPSLSSGFLAKVFGNRRTVIRGGYGISYDRVNTVQSVIIPMLGVGFAQTINVNTPSCGDSGTPGANCNVNSTPGGSLFRVGVDGSIPVPPAPAALTPPIVPDVPLSEILSFQNDPDFQVGRSHMIDFTLQRSLAGQMIFEVGYVGRFGRHLPASVNFNSVPYMFKDKASGQTFAQAFDAVATELRAGTAVTAQPWFENLIPNQCTGPTTSTACVAGANTSSFQNDNLSNLFLNLDFYRLIGGEQPFTNLQVLDLFTRTSRDTSNYNALVVTLRNNNWHGLYFDLNYTFSKSLDTVGAVQNDARYYSSSYNPHLDYGPSFFDRPHVFNAVFNYELPLGKGRWLSSSHSAINRIIGGWYTAGIYRKSSGVPVLASFSGQSFGGGVIFATPAGAIPTVPVSSLGGGSVHDTGDGALNFFSDPDAAAAKFRPALIATDTNVGRSSAMRGLPFWNLDMRFGKTTHLTEQVRAEFSADFFNFFNHANFLDPAFDLTTPETFGVINTQLVPADRNSGARWIQLGLRIDF
jgi:Carboxypeptidase regulatory-like domain